MKGAKIILFSVITLFVLESCQKEEIKNAQIFADKIEGTWTVSKEFYKEKEKSIEKESPWTWTFNNCKVKKDKCTGTQKRMVSGSSMSWDFSYSVSGDGSKGDTISIQGSSTSWNWVVEELGDNEMIYTDGNYRYILAK